MKKFNVTFEHVGTLTCSTIVLANDKDEINTDNIFDCPENIEDLGFDGDQVEIINIEEINEEI